MDYFDITTDEWKSVSIAGEQARRAGIVDLLREHQRTNPPPAEVRQRNDDDLPPFWVRSQGRSNPLFIHHGDKIIDFIDQYVAKPKAGVRGFEALFKTTFALGIFILLGVYAFRYAQLARDGIFASTFAVLISGIVYVMMIQNTFQLKVAPDDHNHNKPLTLEVLSEDDRICQTEINHCQQRGLMVLDTLGSGIWFLGYYLIANPCAKIYWAFNGLRQICAK